MGVSSATIPPLAITRIAAVCRRWLTGPYKHSLKNSHGTHCRAVVVYRAARLELDPCLQF